MLLFVLRSYFFAVGQQETLYLAHLDNNSAHKNSSKGSHTMKPDLNELDLLSYAHTEKYIIIAKVTMNSISLE